MWLDPSDLQEWKLKLVYELVSGIKQKRRRGRLTGDFADVITKHALSFRYWAVLIVDIPSSTTQVVIRQL